jgi:hypothetical protein
MRKIFYLSFFTFYFLLFPLPVSAHAFGVLYTLPLPLWLYLYGAGAALVVSFFLIGFFAKDSTHSLPHLNLKINSFFISLFKSLSLGIFILTIISGFVGSQSPIDSFAINLFWIIFLLGFTYLCAIFGNLWQAINPWKIIFSFFGNVKPVFQYPKKIGYLPALSFYFIWIWLELLSGGLAIRPFILSQILVIYSVITLLSTYLFGKDWFCYGEFFSVYFNLIGKLSFFQKKDEIFTKKADHITLLIFILFMLSSTAFDGFRGTTVWFRFYYGNIIPLEKELGINQFQSTQTILLLLSPLFFFNFYILAIYLMKRLTKIKSSVENLCLHFAYSLIPIAIAYNVAHYYTLLITQGQIFIRLLSDPLNLGWNLFNTIDFKINPAILGANFIWHSEVVVIIIGHILAVYVSHLLALRILSRKAALISQIPMLILMVGYTITGLWILSQPLTVGG